MRMIDLKCTVCNALYLDHLERDEDKTLPNCTECFVEGKLERVYLPTHRGNVIGDECDVWIKNGLCNADGTPRHFTSKSDIRKAERAAGQMNFVRHVGSKGSDKSKHTVKWS